MRPLARYRLVVDWHELWTREYWREYLGPLGGWIGRRVQRLCLRVPQRAFCFSRLVERRLLAEGVNGGVTVLEGQFEGTAADAALPAEPVVVFVGRHIPEKNPVAVVHAVAKARETIPELRAADLRRRPRAAAGAGRDRRARARGRRRGARLRRRGGDPGRARPSALPRPAVAAGGLRPRRARGGLAGDAGRARARRGQRGRGAQSRRARTASSPRARVPATSLPRSRRSPSAGRSSASRRSRGFSATPNGFRSRNPCARCWPRTTASRLRTTDPARTRGRERRRAAGRSVRAALRSATGRGNSPPTAPTPPVARGSPPAP